MKKFHFILLSLLFCSSFLFSEEPDSTKTTRTKSNEKDSSKVVQETVTDTIRSVQSIDLRRKKPLKKPTMAPLHLSDKNKKFSIKVTNDRFRNPEDRTNYDATNMPTNRADYEITEEYVKPYIPITPLEAHPEKAPQPLLHDEYMIPTRQELDILEVLWTKEDVMDTTIYSCLDTTLNITMADLNNLLKQMTGKGMLHRKLVSPRNEFNAFGFMIEMSMKNRRNRVYEYHSNVDREVMRRFINANAYLFKEDSSIVNQKQLKAARGDKTLLEELDAKIYQPQ